MAVEKAQPIRCNILETYTYELQRLLPPEYYQVVDLALVQFNQLLQDNKILEIRLQGANDCISELTVSYKELDAIASDKQRQVLMLEEQLCAEEEQLEQHRETELSEEYRLSQYEKAIQILKDDLKQAEAENAELRNAKIINSALDEIKFEQELKILLERNIADTALPEQCDKPEITRGGQQTEQPGDIEDLEQKHEAVEQLEDTAEIEVHASADEYIFNDEAQDSGQDAQEIELARESEHDSLEECCNIDLNAGATAEEAENADLCIELSEIDGDEANENKELSDGAAKGLFEENIVLDNEHDDAEEQSNSEQPTKKTLKKKQAKKVKSLKAAVTQDLFGDSDSFPDLSIDD